LKSKATAKRIGIYAGTFNPVHVGHVAFALQAIDYAKLDQVYFMPERQPRAKPGTEHFGHRVAMLGRALQPHPRCEILELPDINFSIAKTLPTLQQKFPNSQLVFLFGSDIVPSLPTWPYVKKMMEQCELVIGLRGQDDHDTIKAQIEAWQYQPKVLTMFPSFAASVSSSTVREALLKRQPAQGLLPSVERYSNHHWLYVSLN
jgi:nicotinate-nucleotide adenylyltransferase